MKIALDFDGVLADLIGAIRQHTDYDGDLNEWQKDDPDEFFDAVRSVYSGEIDNVSVVNEFDYMFVNDLQNDGHTVDIVTNTLASDEFVEQWLDSQHISYNDIVRAKDHGCDKKDLSYDCYIDDKPMMAGDVSVLYLMDQPWNQHVRGDGEYIYHSYEKSWLESEELPTNQFATDAPHVIRVESVGHVRNDIHQAID